MANRAAVVSQADIARVIRASHQAGMRVLRIVVRKDSVVVEAIDALQPTCPLPPQPIENEGEIVL